MSERSAITAHAVLAALRRHIGEERGITAERLVTEITGEPERDPAAERELRDAIVELRNEGYHVCAHPSTGYFLAATPEELDRTCLFLYERAMTTLVQIARMKRVSLPDLRGQLRLPT
jgi:regulator of replication initiation timing